MELQDFGMYDIISEWNQIVIFLPSLNFSHAVVICKMYYALAFKAYVIISWVFRSSKSFKILCRIKSIKDENIKIA